MANFDKKLANILVKRGYLDTETRDELMITVQNEGKTLTELLLDEQRIEEEELIGLISIETNRPPINLRKMDFDPEVVQLIPQDLAISSRVLPVAKIGNTLTVAVSDPYDVLTLDDVKIVTQHEIFQVVTSEVSLTDAIEKAYKGPEDGEGELQIDDVEEMVKDVTVGVGLEEEVEEDAPSEEDAGIVRLVNQLIIQAHQKGASDIHIEPYPGSRIDVRCRVDGILRKVTDLPAHFRNAVVSRIKIMADMDITETRKPQDGKIKFKRWGPLDIELRVATIPTAGGCEDVVMRILASSKPLPLDSIGLSPQNYEAMTRIATTPYGIILCVGPTGSGKTTTLHSVLGYINKPSIKIWTAEDPVEITQEGLRQVQTNPKAGLNFARTMRAFLRADPDVIMIGEMRDLETSSTGIEASLTGHLVFSSLHTNNAPETVTRLLEMGIDVFSFADALLGVIAQRLIRTLCKECKEEHPMTQEEYDYMRKHYGSEKAWEALNRPYSKDLTLGTPHEGGCSACEGLGYKGRMGLHELLLNSNEIRELIYKRAKADDIRKAAMANGMHTLKQDGIEKVLQGKTTLPMVLGVCIE